MLRFAQLYPKNEHIIEDDIELFEYDRNDACANEVCPVRNIKLKVFQALKNVWK